MSYYLEGPKNGMFKKKSMTNLKYDVYMETTISGGTMSVTFENDFEEVLAAAKAKKTIRAFNHVVGTDDDNYNLVPFFGIGGTASEPQLIFGAVSVAPDPAVTTVIWTAETTTATVTTLETAE